MESELAINEFVERCKEKFKGNLISVVLFGSVARGTATEQSDIDLLVVSKELPERVMDRHRIFHDVRVDFIMRYSVRLSIICLTPRDFRVDMINPLFYGIFTGYRVLYDPDEFWSDFLMTAKPEIIKTNPEYIEGGINGKRWKIAGII